MESGEHEINLHVDSPGGRARARIQWLPEPDWLVVHVEPVPVTPAGENGQGVHHTAPRAAPGARDHLSNLLAAYLRLQEVNRQKTVFLASAAARVKTPLASLKATTIIALRLAGQINPKAARHPTGVQGKL